MVKTGYKETEIGVIPEDWERKTFPEVFYFKKNNTFSRDMMCSSNGQVQNIHYGDVLIKFSSLLDCSVSFIPFLKSVLNKRNYDYVQSGDIIIADTAEDNMVGKAVEVLAVNKPILSGLHTLLCRPIVYFACGWLGYYINSSVFHNQLIPLITGTKVSSISRSAISNTKILIPPIVEQNKIAEVLSDADTLIYSLEKLIEKKNAIKKGAMQQLLNKNNKAKQVAFGQLSIKIQKGKSISKSGLVAGSIPVIAGGKNPAFYCNCANRTGTTITISASGANAGYVSIHNKNIFATDCSTISQSLNYDIRYIFYLLKIKQYDIYMSQTGGAQPHIQPKDLYALKINYIYDKKEQTAIANILCDMDNEIADLEQKLNKYRQIKQGMMQELLTGRIRLISSKTEKEVSTQALTQSKGHNQKIDDAVVIGAIVDAFYSDKYPLGRKKVQKLLYLLRRKQDASVDAFKKKAAGPYADEVRYKGGEPIAIRNHYVKTIKTPKGTVFVKGEKIDGALHYIDKWQMQSDFDWLVTQFKYAKTDTLELLATIDMAMRDLDNENIVISVDMVKELIHSNKEWTAKLSKSYFSDEDIAWAIDECRKLFKAEG